MSDKPKLNLCKTVSFCGALPDCTKCVYFRRRDDGKCQYLWGNFCGSHVAHVNMSVIMLKQIGLNVVSAESRGVISRILSGLVGWGK